MSLSLPAALAGIKAKDQIVAVCPDGTDKSCKSTQDMNLIEAVKLMRGPRGTKILIQVLREGWSQPKPFVAKSRFNDLIRPQEHRRRDRDPERLSGPEIDHQFELGRLLDGQVGGLGAPEDFVHEAGDALLYFTPGRPIGK